MSAPLSIKTRVQLVQMVDRKYLSIISTHDRSNEIWDALNLVSDDVYRKDRNVGTKIEVWPNPGYSFQEAFSFAAVFAYYVSSEESLETFWHHSPAQHLKAMKRLLDINYGGGLNPLKPLTPSEIQVPLRVLITGLAQKQLNRRANREVDNAYHHQTSIDFYWKSGREAYRRLQFYPRNLFSIFDWHRKMKICETNLKTLDEMYKKAEVHQHRIGRIKAAAEYLAKSFTDNGAKLTLPALHALWVSINESLNRTKADLAKTQAPFSEQLADDAYGAIINATPLDCKAK